jgi:hypothetical protein
VRGTGIRVLIVTVFSLVYSARPHADLVAVRFPEGGTMGFLSLRSPAGAIVASGDFIQKIRGNQVTTRLVYRFKDGSIDDDVAVFTQRRQFRLISDHHVQKGPSFDRPMETTINAGTGQVTVRYRDDHGQEKVESERMDLPPDLANGMLIALLKNVQANALPTLSYLAATPKPRLVRLEVGIGGVDRFVVAGAARRATHYVLKVRIGGVSGVIAPLVGKQPPDIHIWVYHGDVPAFIRAELPLALDGPLFRTELVSPSWR